MIEAIDVHKTYRRGTVEVPAVRGVSLKIDPGEMVAIVGPSGSGKSTLMNLLGALDRPTSGEVRIDGKALSGLSDNELTRLRRDRVGLVFQFFNLLPLLTARENVALPLLLGGKPRAESEARAQSLLERVGLGSRAEHTPDEMSGGEMQRVAVARALAIEPAVILADEPTGNLDTASGNGVLELLRDATRSRCAVVMVTHDPKAAAFADRVLSVADGRIVSESRNEAARTG
jgi:putative ABC transport system ATP-binding protein